MIFVVSYQRFDVSCAGGANSVSISACAALHCEDRAPFYNSNGACCRNVISAVGPKN